MTCGSGKPVATHFRLTEAPVSMTWLTGKVSSRVGASSEREREREFY